MVVVGFVAAIPEKVGDVTKLLWDKGLDVLDGLFGGVKWVWDSEIRGWKIIFGFVGSIPDKVGDVARLLWDKGEDVMGGLFDGVTSVWDSEVRGIALLLGYVTSIPDKVGDVGRLLWDKGSDIAGGFIDGISAGFDAGAGAVKSALNGIIGLVNRVHIPGVSIPDWVPGIGGNGWGGWNPSVPYLAAGVRDFAGGLAVVGERGPELVALPRGANVFSNAESRGMLSGGGVTQIVHIHGNWTAAADAKGRITRGDISYFLDKSLRGLGSSA